MATNFNILPQNSTTGNNDDLNQGAINDLYPALAQCFGTIACGYIAGRLKIITNDDAKGLNTFVGTFALPSLIFTSLVQLDWNTVNWMFLLAILISKWIIFFGVGVVSLLMTRPLNYGRAGILAIFTTQSNDFAIGSPIVRALYQSTHPEYDSYLYLMAPLSLAILNPIGYVMLELSKAKKYVTRNGNEEGNNESDESRQEESSEVTKGQIIMSALKSIVMNPIFFMTVLGVIGGFTLKNGLPDVISAVLDVFGKSFSATALFLLGVRIVESTQYFKGPELLTPIILILVKLLALPLVIRQTVNIINPGRNYSETTDLSTYGFLYGTFPSAPGVFVIATKYDTDVDLVASSMVACTFVSGPIIYISSKMIALTDLSPTDYFTQLENFAFDISALGIVAGLCTLLLFCVTRKNAKMPHKITCCLILSQILECIGVILWSHMETKSYWSIYAQFVLYTFGSISSRLWCGISAVALLFIQYRSLCFVLKLMPLFIVIGWVVPAVIVASLFIIEGHNIIPNTKRNPNFQYGNAQAAVSLFLLVICFIVTLGCLVLHQRYKRRVENYLSLSKDLSSESSKSSVQFINTKDTVINDEERSRFLQSHNEDGHMIQETNIGPTNGSPTGAICFNPNSQPTDIEDLFKSDRKDHRPHEKDFCSSAFGCSGPSRQKCHELIKDYREHQLVEFTQFYNETQCLRHTVLLILLLCSMFVSISFIVWTLVMEGMSGIYIELAFLEACLNFGQTILVAACFASDTDEFWTIIGKYWRKLFKTNRNQQLATVNNKLPTDTKTKYICDQFVRHHLGNCKSAIGSDRFAHSQLYREAFYGSTLVDWLLTVGLADDRREAVNYAGYLIDGGILHHINDVKRFYDRDIIYCFSV